MAEIGLNWVELDAFTTTNGVQDVVDCMPNFHSIGGHAKTIKSPKAIIAKAIVCVKSLEN